MKNQTFVRKNISSCTPTLEKSYRSLRKKKQETPFDIFSLCYSRVFLIVCAENCKCWMKKKFINTTISFIFVRLCIFIEEFVFVFHRDDHIGLFVTMMIVFLYLGVGYNLHESSESGIPWWKPLFLICCRFELYDDHFMVLRLFPRNQRCAKFANQLAVECNFFFKFYSRHFHSKY